MTLEEDIQVEDQDAEKKQEKYDKGGGGGAATAVSG